MTANGAEASATATAKVAASPAYASATTGATDIRLLQANSSADLPTLKLPLKNN